MATCANTVDLLVKDRDPTSISQRWNTDFFYLMLFPVYFLLRENMQTSPPQKSPLYEKEGKFICFEIWSHDNATASS